MLFKITQPSSPLQPHLSDPLSSDFKVSVLRSLKPNHQCYIRLEELGTGWEERADCTSGHGLSLLVYPIMGLKNVVQFSSVAQSCPVLCDPMNRSTPGLPVHHQLPELAQTHVHLSVIPSNHLILVIPFFSCLQSFPTSGSFPMSLFFTSGGQSI